MSEHKLLFDAFKMGYEAGKHPVTTNNLAKAREITNEPYLTQSEIRQVLVLILDELDGQVNK
jgi:hypothetical protein